MTATNAYTERHSDVVPHQRPSNAFCFERLSDPLDVHVRTFRADPQQPQRQQCSSIWSSRQSSTTSSVFTRDSFASAFPSPTSSSPASSSPASSSPRKRQRASALLSAMRRSIGSSICPAAMTTTRHSTDASACNSTSSSSSHRKLFAKASQAPGSTSSTSSGSPRPVAVPHTITERHGGRDLWVKAPMLAGAMEKQGFRWRKKWKVRHVELNSRMLSYYEVVATPASASTNSQTHAVKARRRAQITADAILEDLDARSFAITPSATERPWIFRAADTATKLRWCKALTDVIDILAWLQHYEVGDLLGVGGNGVVHAIADKRTGKRFAVKSVDVAKFRNRAAVVSEVEILRSITNNIKHPNLVTIYKVYEELDKIHIILELCEGGELYDSIVQRGCYRERDAARILQQLASALQALHAYNILHLDLKPENILFASNAPDAKIVLTDFGLARMINGKSNPLESGTSMAGTVGYIAPEVVSAHSYTAAADVFSAGVILFILLVGYPPFQGDSEVEILLKIARGDFQFHKADWAHVSPMAMDLVAQMLQVRADDRISVDAILQHPWLQSHANSSSSASVHTTSASDDGATDRALAKTIERLQQFNLNRKSENMATFMSTMLLDSNEADYSTLADTKVIDVMIRQLSPDGCDRLPLAKAHVLAKGLGLSPFMDATAFVSFLDQDNDGFLTAQDFCDGVKAVRRCDASFAAIVFAALHAAVGHDGATIDAPLCRNDFVVAFERLQCPEPLSSAFFKVVDAQMTTAQVDDIDTNGSVDRPTTISSNADAIDWRVDTTAFATLSTQHSFLSRLFLRTAKANMTHMVTTRSVEVFPQILED